MAKDQVGVQEPAVRVREDWSQPNEPTVPTAKHPPSVKDKERQPSQPVAGKWFVWLLPSGSVPRPKLIVDAKDKDQAWEKFCQANGAKASLEGGRVIRQALDHEVTKAA